MTIFSSGVRTDPSPARYGESQFRFLDRVSGDFWDAVRELVNLWFDHVPAEARRDLQRRLTGADDHHFAGAFLELYLHEVLVRGGYDVRCHPPIPGTTRQPDFLASRDGDSFYLEARALGGSAAGVAARNRLNAIYDQLDRLNSPNFFLWINIDRAGTQPPPTKHLRARLEGWLRDLDPDAVSGQEAHLDRLPAFQWSERGWSITFRAIPKSPDARGREGVRPLGILGGLAAQWVDEAGPLRGALRDKGSSYGELDRGLVVALGTSFFSRDSFGVLGALYGSDQVVIRFSDDGSEVVGQTRSPDGYFHVGGPSWGHRQVSGVLIVNNLHPARVSQQVDTLWVHPDPHHPLNGPEVWARMVPTESELVREEPRTSPGDLLGLPEPWPPGEPFPGE